METSQSEKVGYLRYRRHRGHRRSERFDKFEFCIPTVFAWRLVTDATYLTMPYAIYRAICEFLTTHAFDFHLTLFVPNKTTVRKWCQGHSDSRIKFEYMKRHEMQPIINQVMREVNFSEWGP